ncbi:MAG TPA: glucan biosynthesis protein G [Xanthobacteraceae bacterium]|nr:glucan biosynthesis protein G [Xanthobacteraceae bacterium]
MNRRAFLAGSVLGTVAAARAWGEAPATTPAPVETQEFDAETVRRLARALSEKPFEPQDASLPQAFKDLDYDTYRSIRYRPDRALWRGEGLPFEVQFFHRGFIFAGRVDVYEVVGSSARPIRYAPALFDFGKAAVPPDNADLGFAGFRLHAPINRPDYYDEVGVFLGASYFRAVAKDQVYGLSARGLSLRTGDPNGEEFPVFKTFWIERPNRQADSIVVHALLDSESATAAYRFTIRPGATTVYEVELSLFPRVDIDKAGFGTLTSMYFFDSNDRVGVDDFRLAVHDSDGLAIRNGYGEELWRPLVNPRDLQVSIFSDSNPRGFGLLQRQRDFRAYEDLESHFEKRPSCWVEPTGPFGEGAVHLLEIPTKEEIHDNVVAFWRPRGTLRAKQEHRLAYRLHWGADKPNKPALAEFVKTRVGAGPNHARLFVLELKGAPLSALDPANVKATVSADKGTTRNPVLQRNPETDGWRFSFELLPEKNAVVELRAQLVHRDKPVSEVWVYRWTPG